uniref:Uncharacterized protein n=1 Tax=Lates calcarifer TaxID=8187 RepID=A0A4W6ELD2_LATCA
RSFLPFYVLTSDLHHIVLGLHHQLLRREVVDIQGHLPAGTSLLGHHGSGVHHGGMGDHAVLRHGGHAEGLVEDAAALVPVTEWVPAWGAEQGERDMSLSHGLFWNKRQVCSHFLLRTQTRFYMVKNEQQCFSLEFM